MTDRLDAIAADLERPEVLNTENGCSVANVGSGDVRWLVAEVRRLRETHAAAVEKAFRAGYSAGGDDMSAAYHNEYYIGEDAAWLASEAKARLT